MEAVVRKWGNSAAVRIPARELGIAGLSVDDAVVLHAESGRIIIEPQRPKKVSLDDLIAGIQPENVHAAVDTGDAVGNEAW